jgi:hypothetical protein
MAIFDNRGGGQALPPFLQGRSRSTGPFGTQPMIAPKSTIAPGEAGGPMGIFNRLRKPQPKAPGAWGSGPQITPRPTALANSMAPPPVAPAMTKPPAQGLFEFMKQDLVDERNKALANARTSASERGVYYGTPLTTSEGDINTQFLRGEGQLQAGILQNQEQNELQRLQVAMGLIGNPASFGQLSGMGQINPELFSIIGSLFAPRPKGTSPNITPMTPPKPGMAPGSGIPSQR